MTASLWKKIGLLSVLMTVLYYALPRLNITLSPSLDHWVFWQVSGTPASGEYALFTLQHSLLGTDNLEITKQLRCTEGQILRTEDREFYCDDLWLGTAKSVSTRGETMPLFIYDGPVPGGKAFVMGSHPDSFDSRYWGFVSLDETTRMKPLL